MNRPDSPGNLHEQLYESEAWETHLRLRHLITNFRVFQLNYSDIDISTYPAQPPGSVLPLFAAIGFVDVDLRPKPSFATYDSIFARPLKK